jgi:hypothetical protein
MPEPKTAKKRAAKAPASPSAASELSREEIARRAYEIAQGEDAGSDEENWLRAEAELRRES